MGFKMWPLGVISDLDIVADLPLRQSAEMGEKPQKLFARVEILGGAS
jgi:hypothetical protein